MLDLLKPFISRIVAGIVASFLAFLTAKNINVDGDTAQQAIAAITGLALAVFSAIYAVIHKLIDKHVNPADAAANSVVAHGESVQLKADIATGKI